MTHDAINDETKPPPRSLLALAWALLLAVTAAAMWLLPPGAPLGVPGSGGLEQSDRLGVMGHREGVEGPQRTEPIAETIEPG